MFHLPFAPRCGFAPIFERRQLWGSWARTTAIAGGQLSYDPSNCSAPIVTLNDLHIGRWPYTADNERWRRADDAPFLPRRSMQLEDAVVSTDTIVRAAYFDVFDDDSTFDKTATLAGGIRFLSHRFDAQLNRSVMTAAEIYSDTWTCDVVYDESRLPSRDTALGCDWAHHFMDPHLPTNSALPYSPSASLPLPVAFGASAPFPLARALLGIRIGGATSSEAVAAWSNTRVRREPRGESERLREGATNVTVLQHPDSFFNRITEGAATVSEVLSLRYRLPFSYRVGEEELNAADSSFSLGSSAVLSHTTLHRRGNLKPAFTSVSVEHGQPLPLPVNARASAEPFDSRRLGHSMAGTWDTAIISAGYSGALHFNDWVTYEGAQCWWPEDPSYLSQLGPLRFLFQLDENNRISVDYSPASYQRYWDSPQVRATTLRQPILPHMLGAFRPGEDIVVECGLGYHFDPPLPAEADTATLTCASDSLWVDVQLGGVRRCVKDTLSCPHPLVDAGYAECVEPLPSVSSLEVLTAFMNDGVGRANSADAATVTSIDDFDNEAEYHDTLQLVIRGQFFTQPITVTVGTTTCASPQLRNISVHCDLKGRIASSRDSTDVSGCLEFGASVVCLLRLGLVEHQSVSLSTGRGLRRRTISHMLMQGQRSMSARPTALTLSLQQPAVTRVTAPAEAGCVWSDLEPLHLTGCASTAPIQVSICGVSFGYTTDVRPVDVFYGGTKVEVTDWRRDGPQVRCVNSVTDFWPCYGVTHCAIVTVEPIVGQQAAITVTQTRVLEDGTRLSNTQQTSGDLLNVPTIAFRPCDAGTALDVTVIGGQPRQRCVACPPGSSTLNTTGAQQCFRCPAGTFAAGRGSVECIPCAPGTHSSESASAACEPCRGNSWQPSRGQTECLKCQDDEYLVLPLAVTNPSIAPSPNPVCKVCPAGADCGFQVGNLTARAGFFLLIDQQAGIVSSVECAFSACTGVVNGAAGTDGDGIGSCDASSVQSTGLTVINCCGLHRVTSSALCAECQAGYTEAHGRCIECGAVQWGPLFGVLLLAFVLVSLLHRLSLESSTASASLSLFLYFVQMSLLFLSSERVPSVLHLLDIDLLGDSSSCIVPLTDYGKIAARLLSPFVAVGLLFLLAFIQVCHQRCIRLTSAGTASRRWLMRMYHVTWPAGSDGRTHSGGSWAKTHLQQLRRPLVEYGEDEEEMKGVTGNAAAPLPVLLPNVATDSWAHLVRQYQRTLMRLLLFSYNTLTSVTVAFFYTRDLGDYGQRLWQYPSIDARSSTYLALRPLMGLLLAFPVLSGPLVLLLYLLWRRHHATPNTAAALMEDVDDGQMQMGPVVSARSAGLLSALLTSSFRPRYELMGVAVLARRLVLILVWTFVQSSVWVWLSMLDYLVLLVHTLSWPYHRHLDNWMEAMTLLALSLQTTLLSAYPDAQDRPLAVRAVLWSLLGFPAVMLIILRAVESCRWWWVAADAPRGVIATSALRRFESWRLKLSRSVLLPVSHAATDFTGHAVAVVQHRSTASE